MLGCASTWLKMGLRVQSSCSALHKGSRCSWQTPNGVRNYKVTLVGTTGGIGQPLAMLLKQNPLINELTLHDVEGTKGVATDISHICTSTQVDFFEGPRKNDLLCSLEDTNVVVVCAGLPRKPGMTRDQLFSVNASVAMAVACAVCDACPEALVAFITNPVNSIVPVAAEIMKSKGAFNPNRLFGVTTLDVVRAKTFIADYMNINPAVVNIPVIGGHAGISILPIFSQCSPKFTGDEEDIKRLTERIQEAGTEVVNAKAGKGSATLSMSYSAAHFVNALLRGLKGESNVIECAYVASDVTDLGYLSTPLELGPEGIKQNLGLPPMDQDEEEAFKRMLPLLKINIETGISFAKQVMQTSNPAEDMEKSNKESESVQNA